MKQFTVIHRVTVLCIGISFSGFTYATKNVPPNIMSKIGTVNINLVRSIAGPMLGIASLIGNIALGSNSKGGLIFNLAINSMFLAESLGSGLVAPLLVEGVEFGPVGIIMSALGLITAIPGVPASVNFIGDILSALLEGPPGYQTYTNPLADLLPTADTSGLLDHAYSCCLYFQMINNYQGLVGQEALISAQMAFLTAGYIDIASLNFANPTPTNITSTVVNDFTQALTNTDPADVSCWDWKENQNQHCGPCASLGLGLQQTPNVPFEQPMISQLISSSSSIFTNFQTNLSNSVAAHLKSYGITTAPSTLNVTYPSSGACEDVLFLYNTLTSGCAQAQKADLTSPYSSCSTWLTSLLNAIASLNYYELLLSPTNPDYVTLTTSVPTALNDMIYEKLVMGLDAQPAPCYAQYVAITTDSNGNPITDPGTQFQNATACALCLFNQSMLDAQTRANISIFDQAIMNNATLKNMSIPKLWNFIPASCSNSSCSIATQVSLQEYIIPAVLNASAVNQNGLFGIVQTLAGIPRFLNDMWSVVTAMLVQNAWYANTLNSLLTQAQNIQNNASLNIVQQTQQLQALQPKINAVWLQVQSWAQAFANVETLVYTFNQKNNLQTSATQVPYLYDSIDFTVAPTTTDTQANIIQAYLAAPGTFAALFNCTAQALIRSSNPGALKNIWSTLQQNMQLLLTGSIDELNIQQSVLATYMQCCTPGTQRLFD